MIRNRILSALCASLLFSMAAACGAEGQGEDTMPTPGFSGDGMAGEPSGDSQPASPASPPLSAAPTPAPSPAPAEEPAPAPSVEPVPEPTTEPAPAPTAEPAPAPGSDAFGITMLYPTKPGGETWSLPDNALGDSRFDPKETITRNADGSWKMKSSKVRMSVFTTTGYDTNKIPTYDPDVLTSRGYMQAPNDWKNVEMTGYVKVNAAGDWSDNFAWYARGGRHNDSMPCEGSSYKGSLHYDGRVRWQKEAWHVSYDQTAYQPGTASLKGRWVGFKSIMKNTTVNGKPAVKLELWLDENADKVSWKKVYDVTDSGQLGGDTTKCGGAVNGMPLVWGGPIATFRWDSASDVDFKWLSVREIAE